MKKRKVKYDLFGILEFVEENLTTVQEFVKAYKALEDAILGSDKFPFAVSEKLSFSLLPYKREKGK